MQRRGDRHAPAGADDRNAEVASRPGRRGAGGVGDVACWCAAGHGHGNGTAARRRAQGGGGGAGRDEGGGLGGVTAHGSGGRGTGVSVIHDATLR